jgi:hypothetical protein
VAGTCESGNGFYKMRGISWLSENRLASQEGLCSMEQVGIGISRSPVMGYNL